MCRGLHGKVLSRATTSNKNKEIPCLSYIAFIYTRFVTSHTPIIYKYIQIVAWIIVIIINFIHLFLFFQQHQSAGFNSFFFLIPDLYSRCVCILTMMMICFAFHFFVFDKNQKLRALNRFIWWRNQPASVLHSNQWMYMPM